MQGAIKSLIFALVVTWIALFNGYDAKPTSAGISQATYFNWKKRKKARLYIIGGLLLIVVILGIFFESIRAWMIGVGIVLLVALGFEVTNTDLD